jgi:hypothetical protein
VPVGRPQASVTFRPRDPLLTKLNRAERLTGKTRGTILRELIDYFLEPWLAYETDRAGRERGFRDALQRLGQDQSAKRGK